MRGKQAPPRQVVLAGEGRKAEHPPHVIPDAHFRWSSALKITNRKKKFWGGLFILIHQVLEFDWIRKHSALAGSKKETSSTLLNSHGTEGVAIGLRLHGIGGGNGRWGHRRWWASSHPAVCKDASTMRHKSRQVGKRMGKATGKWIITCASTASVDKCSHDGFQKLPVPMWTMSHTCLRATRVTKIKYI